MIVETQVFQTLRALVDGRVYPDMAPAGSVKPYIVYQQVGGASVNFLDPTMPSKRNSWMQVCAWAEARVEASSLIERVELALRGAAGMQVAVQGAPVSTYDDVTQLRGARQDYSIWI
ncbi:MULTISPECIES: DUF3168 domain-containing protein [unclassified Janthinobacterium]|uniref:DUF3168 domain-containing protein n=1 Tax=unclassified Janthinobacterium TaxID=2610881 RepID=UPI000875863F|nr:MULTISPECIES: DUF3168 domain-containing protein [unclassified Janthinobacterium]